MSQNPLSDAIVADLASSLVKGCLTIAGIMLVLGVGIGVLIAHFI